jgi:hypothetical protein
MTEATTKVAVRRVVWKPSLPFWNDVFRVLLPTMFAAYFYLSGRESLAPEGDYFLAAMFGATTAWNAWQVWRRRRSR